VYSRSYSNTTAVGLLIPPPVGRGVLRPSPFAGFSESVGSGVFVDLLGGYGYFRDSLRDWRSRLEAQPPATFRTVPVMRERLLFVGLLIAAAAVVPMLAAGVRSRLRAGRSSRRNQVLAPARYGFSPRSRRSPRHAVLLHRGLVGAVFMALLALFLIPAASSLSELGVSVIPVAFTFVLPTLLVTLHTRRRSLRR
jgi:hypothetical protein